MDGCQNDDFELFNITAIINNQSKMDFWLEMAKKLETELKEMEGEKSGQQTDLVKR